MCAEICVYIVFPLPILDLHGGPLLMLIQDPEHGGNKYLQAVCDTAIIHVDQRAKSRIDINTGLLLNLK